MAEKKEKLSGTRFLVIAGAIVVIIYGINQAQSVIALFFLSVFLALIGTPAVLWLENKRVPSFLSVMIVMAGMVVLLLLIGVVVGDSLNTFSGSLPYYQTRLREQVLSLKPFLASKHIVVSDKVLIEYLNPGSFIKLATGLFAGMGSVLSDMLLVLLTVAFILLEASSFPIKLRSVLGDPQRGFPQSTKFVNDIKRYMIVKTIINLAGGILVGLWVYILGVDFPILWGFVAFLLHYIPNLGTILASIPPIFLALLQFGPGHALLVAGGYLVVGFTIGNIIEPHLMGRKLGLSTLVVFLSLIFWGSILGPIGVILCIPLTMTLKFAFESNNSTVWIATLLSSEEAAAAELPSVERESTSTGS